MHGEPKQYTSTQYSWHLGSVLLYPGVWRSDDQDTTRHNEVWQSLKELHGLWQPADEVPSKYTAKLTQLREVAGITYCKLYPSTILRCEASMMVG